MTKNDTDLRHSFQVLVSNTRNMGERSKGAIELAAIRSTLRFSQRAMAEQVGLQPDQYRNYEYRKPPEWLLEKARAVAESMKEYDPSPKGRLPDLQDETQLRLVPLEFAKDGYFTHQLAEDDFSMLPYLHPKDVLIFKPGSQMGAFVIIRKQKEVLVRKLGFTNHSAAFKATNPGASDESVDEYKAIGVLVGILPYKRGFVIGPHEEGIDESFLINMFQSRIPGAA